MGIVAILDYPEMAPQKCSGCGGAQADGRKYIDLGISLDYYGVLYLCSHCLNEGVRAVGEYTPLSEYQDMRHERDHYRTLCETLTQKVGALNAISDGISALYSINDRLAEFGFPSSGEVSKTHRNDNGESQGTDGVEGQADRKLDEQTPSRGSSNLFGDE